MVECWRWLSGHLNRKTWRWTPYVLQAFLSVAGFEMCQQIGTQQTSKLLKVLISKPFLAQAKAVGSFSAEDTQNDIDRYKAFVDSTTDRMSGLMRGGRLFDPPGAGDDEDDARKLILENTNNNG